MAEGKKSFLLYADYIHTFEHLSDEEAGKLIKVLFRYVNDQNPQLEDRLLKIAFEPIKMQLKRDLSSWESEKGKRSDNASMGNLKKYHPILYDKVIKQEIDLDAAMLIAYGRTRSSTTGDDGQGSDTVTMLTDNVTVNVTDTVNVTVNDTDTVIPSMFASFKKTIPDYPGSKEMDFKPLFKIATFIVKQLNLKGSVPDNKNGILKEWKILCGLIVKDSFYKIKPLSVIANQIQGVWQLKNKQTGSTTGMVEAPKAKNYYKKNR